MRLSFEQNQKTYNSQTVSGEFKAGSIPATVLIINKERIQPPMKYHKIIELNKTEKIYLVTNIINDQVIDTPELVELKVSDILTGTKTHNELCETYKVENFIFKETENSVYLILKEREIYKSNYDSQIKDLPLFGRIFDAEAFIQSKTKEKDRLNRLINKIDRIGESLPYFFEKRKRRNSDYEYNLDNNYRQRTYYDQVHEIYKTRPESLDYDDANYLLYNLPVDYFIDLYCQKINGKHIYECNFDEILPENIRLTINEALKSGYNIAELCYDWAYTDVSEFEFDNTIREYIKSSTNQKKLINNIYLYGYRTEKNNGK